MSVAGEDQRRKLSPSFVKRTMFQVLLVGAVFLCWRLAPVFLLGFGAILLALLLRSIADPLRDRTRLNDPAALSVAGLVILSAVALSTWLFGSLLWSQAQDLAARLPSSVGELKTQVAKLPMGSQLTDGLFASGSMTHDLRSLVWRVGGYATNVAGAMANVVVVTFTGIFIAIHPKRTRDGVLTLIPNPPRGAVGLALDATGRALKLWLLGTLVDMLAVGAMTGLGAWVLGLPSPLALAAIAALFDFVPIVGPIISLIPGVLVAVPLGAQTVLWTVALYVAVQQIEGNLIYPLVQRRAVDLPPSLSILGVVAFGILFGLLGVILATPSLVVLLVMTKTLYVRDALGEPISVPGEAASGKQSG